MVFRDKHSTYVMCTYLWSLQIWEKKKTKNVMILMIKKNLTTLNNEDVFVS